MSDYVRKSLQNLDLGINDVPIALPAALCGQAVNANRYSLIVSVVNPRKQNLKAIVNQMPKIWGFSDDCRGRVLGNGRVLFIFKTGESLQVVLRRGPWAFNDWMLSVHRWYPNISEETMKIIPFWIQVRGIPFQFLNEAMVNYIGDQIGDVAEVDFDENANLVEFIRICVNWNVDVPLRFQRNFQFGGDENTILKFKYERLRNFCSKCGCLQHDAKECPLTFDDQPDMDGDD
ncbi:hypothetical protein CARUB_v10022172mg, partial [Capsella rubella]